MKLLRPPKMIEESLGIERKVTFKNYFLLQAPFFLIFLKKKIQPLEIFGFKKHKI